MLIILSKKQNANNFQLDFIIPKIPNSGLSKVLFLNPVIHTMFPEFWRQH